MEPCVNHPDHAAIEHCEICGNALCDLCLWYDDDGRRLCEQHAREHQAAGGSVQSPELYREAIQVKEVDETAVRSPYLGNEQDLWAAAAAMAGVAALLTMCGGAYCLPVIALILGILALNSTRQSLNPDRTRTLGWIGLGLSSLSLLPLLLFFCIFIFTLTVGIASSSTFGP